jgi:[ribosomal protein S18]-alanine N-acetyltransferase
MAMRQELALGLPVCVMDRTGFAGSTQFCWACSPADNVATSTDTETDNQAMPVDPPMIRLATPSEASPIARMSRDMIEFGLSWSWTTQRVQHAIHDSATNVAVALRRDRLQAFGIMQYGDDSAHLVLLAVRPALRHQGLGGRLTRWLEASAQMAGLERVLVEARADNHNAIAFYQRLGYRRTATVAGYYEGKVDAIRLERRLV